MNKLRAIKLFVRLVDLGSFASVADEINSTSSMVSKEISKLETDIGARLLHRSTRNLQLTSVGRGYLARCREIIAQMEDADAYVQQEQNNLQGLLKINAPMVLGLIDLGKVFADFMQMYPQVTLDIHLGDESLDLVEHGFDLGFRASSRPLDSNYIGKPLKSFTYQVCASPEYLSRHPDIQTERDLIDHNCFIYSYFKGGNEWPINNGIHISGNLKVNSTLFMRDAIEAGLGIGFLPSFVAEQSLQNGTLVEILNATEKPTLTLYALYPNRKFVPPILAKCIEFLGDWFSSRT
ncbi:LysR family transcriptional regulator [Oleiphilus messinensis]|uniref:LysR family transcriptional regulator n=1 Tax=Oleiphilus messinensis TaxID=141451 RepID=A0A1Y0I9L9_9GAMM|nr:LysR family transcriptional regulator [Oleiphilus messinensis]ARU57217.1 LysR family transcriptional regulator [Oleiphilus messinensis]